MLNRYSALEIRPGRCRVLFRDDTTGDEEGWEMDTVTYRLIPYDNPATPGTFIMAAAHAGLGGTFAAAPLDYDDYFLARPAR